MAYIVAGAVVVLIALWFLTRGGKYKKVFADEHFLEVAGRVPALKEAALAQAERPADVSSPLPVDDPRRVVTSAGLVVLYTIAPEGAGFEHHVSVSLDGAYTAHAVGDMFVWWILRLLGVDVRRCGLLISPRTVHFAIWIIDRAEHAEFSGRPVGVPAAAQVAEFRKEWVQSWQSVRWERIPR